MAATADPYNAVDPIKKRRTGTGIPVLDAAASAANNFNAAATDIVDAPLGVVNQGLRAAFGEGIPEYNRNLRTLAEDTGVVNDATLDPDLQRRRGLLNADGARTPTPVAAAPAAPAAPAAIDPNAYGMGPQQGEFAAPEGVTRRGDGIFAGKGVHGEQVFSDSAFAPQFAGVAGAGEQGRKDYERRFQQDRPVQNASDYTFQRAREAEIKAAGEDYKRYVAAGSPRTQDGRGLSEYDFLQRRQHNSLENFLDSEAGGSGSRASDRGGLPSGVGRRDGGQADAIALNTALGDTAKTKQDLAKGDIEIDKLANERADTQFGELSKRYTENPDLARQFGPGVSPSDAAAAELAMNMTLSQTDPLSTEVGRRGVAILERIAGQTNADRPIFAGRDGDFPVGSAPAALENYSVDKRGLGARLINKLTGDPDFVLQSPAFDKRDGKRNVPIDPNDPNAERFTNYETGLPGILGGQRGQEFLLRYQDIAKRRNKKE